MAKLHHRSISKRMVEGLEVDKDTIFWDRELSGFGVRAYASGKKVYIVQARAKGKSRRVTVGRHGGADRRAGASAGSADDHAHQGGRGGEPQESRSAQAGRSDGCRVGGALPDGARGGPVQAEDGGAWSCAVCC